VRQLLPKGQYWQDPTNAELNNLIAGMGIDFRVTHDEVQLALLTELDNELFGWRLADYQNLMEECGVNGKVTDTPAIPNLISVNVDATSEYDGIVFAFNQERLPHTQFQWFFDATDKEPANVYVGAYKTVVHEITIGPKPPEPNVYGSFYAAPYITSIENIEVRLK
jgi:hypothetical protein